MENIQVLEDSRSTERRTREVLKGGRSMEDEAIVELYWRRDEDAIRFSQTKYGGYCSSIAKNLLADRWDVEECVNDTWLRAWNAIPPQRPAKLRAFLAKITRNLALDQLKAKGRAKRGGGELTLALEELGECVPSPGGVEEALQGRELEGAVNAFLRVLPTRDRDIFLRRYFFVEPVGEIAVRYAMGENAVSAALSRTRKKLRIHLEKEGWI